MSHLTMFSFKETWKSRWHYKYIEQVKNSQTYNEKEKHQLISDKEEDYWKNHYDAIGELGRGQLRKYYNGLNITLSHQNHYHPFATDWQALANEKFYYKIEEKIREFYPDFKYEDYYGDKVYDRSTNWKYYMYKDIFGSNQYTYRQKANIYNLMQFANDQQFKSIYYAAQINKKTGTDFTGLLDLAEEYVEPLKKLQPNLWKKIEEQITQGEIDEEIYLPNQLKILDKHATQLQRIEHEIIKEKKDSEWTYETFWKTARQAYQLYKTGTYSPDFKQLTADEWFKHYYKARLEHMRDVIPEEEYKKASFEDFLQKVNPQTENTTTTTTTMTGTETQKEKQSSDLNKNAPGPIEATQRGYFKGTLPARSDLEYREWNYKEYISCNKFERVFRWCNEYQNHNSTFFKNHSYKITAKNDERISMNEITSDAVIANCWYPTTGYIFDDFMTEVMITAPMYDKCRLKCIKYDVVFSNRPLDHGMLVGSQITQNQAGSGAISDETRFGTNPANNYLVVGTSKLARNFNDPNSTNNSAMFRYGTMEMNSKSDFHIYRDVFGRMVLPNGKPKCGTFNEPTLGDYKQKATGPSVAEVNVESDHFNRRQIENFERGYTSGNSINVERYFNPQQSVVMTRQQAIALKDANIPLDQYVAVVEGVPTTAGAYTTGLKEYFNYYFVPKGELPFYDLASQNTSQYHPTILYMFETVAHITIQACWELFDRKSFTDVVPRSITLNQDEESAIIKALREQVEFQTKQYNEQGSYKVAKPSTFGGGDRTAHSILPYESSYKKMKYSEDEHM